MSNHNLEISPSNILSSGVISFRNGNPIISFIIGEQDRLLIGRSVRLAGKFRLKMNKMTRVIERNVAEIIMIGVFLTILLSSCGGSKCIYKKDWRKSNCWYYFRKFN